MLMSRKEAVLGGLEIGRDGSLVWEPSFLSSLRGIREGPARG